MIEKKLHKKIKKTLSEARWKHTLAVSQWAEDLAFLHDADPIKAALAGLLHDCAKEWSGKKLSQYIVRHKITVPHQRFILESKHYGLFHAYVGAHWAQSHFKIKDRDILSAIRGHTFGNSKMTLLDRILYVADFSAPGRPYPEAAKIRQIAQKNLSQAYKKTLQMKILNTLTHGSALHPMTVRLWNKESRVIPEQKRTK